MNTIHLDLTSTCTKYYCRWCLPFHGNDIFWWLRLLSAALTVKQNALGVVLEAKLVLGAVLASKFPKSQVILYWIFFHLGNSITLRLLLNPLEATLPTNVTLPAVLLLSFSTDSCRRFNSSHAVLMASSTNGADFWPKFRQSTQAVARSNEEMKTF